MRRPHVYERSAPRSAREPYREPDTQAEAARAIAERLGGLIEIAAAAGLTNLIDMLEVARREAERLAKG